MKFALGRVKDLKKSQNVKYIIVLAASVFLATIVLFRPLSTRRLHRRPLHAEHLLNTCRALRIMPGPSSDFASRTESDRYVPGTNATWIRNATIWIGRAEGTYESGDVLLHKGLILKVGHITKVDLPSEYEVINANGGVCNILHITSY
jgi:hypothetical protein